MNQKTETEVQNDVLLNTGKLGWRLFRNNVGVAIRRDGVPVRYGLANVTKAMNQQLKSSDLIGIRPVVITQEMVGQTIGQFVAVECKSSRTNLTKQISGRMIAQNNFLQLIKSLGGHAEFNNTGEIE